MQGRDCHEVQLAFLNNLTSLAEEIAQPGQEMQVNSECCLLLLIATTEQDRKDVSAFK